MSGTLGQELFHQASYSPKLLSTSIPSVAARRAPRCLAAPSVPDEARQVGVERAEAGEEMTVAIAIGDEEAFGFIARELDYGGVVYEDDRPRTLAEALAALEEGLREISSKAG